MAANRRSRCQTMARRETAMDGRAKAREWPCTRFSHPQPRGRHRLCTSTASTSRAELAGADLDVDAIRESVRADSLHYISLEGLLDSTPDRRETLHTACFTGDYPVPVPGEHEELAQI